MMQSTNSGAGTGADKGAAVRQLYRLIVYSNTRAARARPKALPARLDSTSRGVCHPKHSGIHAGIQKDAAVDFWVKIIVRQK